MNEQPGILSGFLATRLLVLAIRLSAMATMLMASTTLTGDGVALLMAFSGSHRLTLMEKMMAKTIRIILISRLLWVFSRHQNPI